MSGPSEFDRIAARARLFASGSSAVATQELNRLVAPLEAGADSFAARFWLRGRTETYRRDVQRFKAGLRRGSTRLE